MNIIPKDVPTNVDLLEENEDLTWEQATEQAKAIVVHGDKINEAIEREILNGATEENSDMTIRSWVKKDYCVFARTTPAQSKTKKKIKKFSFTFEIKNLKKNIFFFSLSLSKKKN